MIHSQVDFMYMAKGFIGQFDEFVKKHNLSEDIGVDHLCYHASDSIEYERMRAILERKPTRFVHQVLGDDRRISYIGLQKGTLKALVGDINYIELSETELRKPGQVGFHHIEIYISSTRHPEDVCFEADKFAEYFEKRNEKVLQHKNRGREIYDIILPNRFMFRIGDQLATNVITEGQQV